MSLFYSDPPSNTSKNQNTEITPQAVVMLLVAVLAMAGYSKRSLLEVFYYRNFELIYLSAYALIATFVVLAIWQVKKRTKKISHRMNLLSFLFGNEKGTFVGKSQDNISLSLPDRTRLEHVQIIGSTGRGKTKSVILPWLCRDIVAGKSAILIDGKGDPEFVDVIKTVAECSRYKPDVHVFDLGNPKASCVTNPLLNGSPQQITDRLFQAFQFSDPYYKSVQYSITGAVVSLVREVDTKDDVPGVVTFQRIYELLSDMENLTAALTKSKVGNQALLSFASMNRNEREQRVSGLLSQLAPFAVGEVAELVNGKEGAVTISDLLLTENRPQVFIVLIPTLKYQELGHQLGKLLCQELAWAIGERASRVGNRAAFTPVYLDEFSAFVYPGFAQILNKARSSQVAIHLSHQSLGDLSVVSPDFAKIITTNTNVKCILGLNDPETADWFARHLGTETSEKKTERAQDPGFFSSIQKTGDLSLREVEAYKIHPNRLKNYTRGWGVLHLPSPLGNITEEVHFSPFSSEELPDNH